MRRLVGAIAVACLLCSEFERPGMDSRVLFSGSAFQLSALHGHGLPRLSHAQRVREVQDFHRTYCPATCSGWRCRARLVRRAALDFHFVCLLEPLALHWAEFWIADDVCAACRDFSDVERAACAASCVYRVFCFVDAEFSYRAVGRSADSFAGASGDTDSASA